MTTVSVGAVGKILIPPRRRRPEPILTGSTGISLNAVVCLRCLNVIESKYRWHFKRCCCGAVSVDGGLDYLKRGFQPDAEWLDISYNEKGWANAD